MVMVDCVVANFLSFNTKSHLSKSLVLWSRIGGVSSVTPHLPTEEANWEFGQFFWLFRDYESSPLSARSAFG